MNNKKNIGGAFSLLKACLMALLVAITMPSGTSEVNAAVCGGNNQRPCKFFERVPSCNKGLVENFKLKRCVPKRSKTKPKRRKPKKKVLRCGKLNQKPCPITTGRKSCDLGLVENFRLRRCVRKKRLVCGGLNEKPCPITTGRRSCKVGLVENFKRGRCELKRRPRCGGLNQKPCPITTGRSSCNKGLVENFLRKRCERQKRIVCGALNQKPCPITTGRKSCNPGLVENFRRNRCELKKRIVCGALNQRPCPITSGRKSCNPGLVENFRRNRCERKKPVICGGLNQKPCLRSPACKTGLVANRLKNRCQRAAGRCGGVGQKPCRLHSGRQSCNPGLVENFRTDRCERPQGRCGGLNQKPCLITSGRQSCNPGLAEDFVKNLCVKPNGLESLKELGQSCFRRFLPAAAPMKRLSACVSRSALREVLKRAIRRKHAGSAFKIVKRNCEPELRALGRTLARLDLKSMSVGIGSDLGGIIGVNSEVALAINTNLRGKPHLYATLGYRAGLNVGVSVNAVISGNFARAASLAGTGQSLSVSLKAAGGAGASVQMSYQQGSTPPNCTGFSVSPGAGAEVNAGSLGRTVTVRITR